VKYSVRIVKHNQTVRTIEKLVAGVGFELATKYYITNGGSQVSTVRMFGVVSHRINANLKETYLTLRKPLERN